MKELLLLRHAKSSWATPGLADFDRPLNKRGRRAAAALARFLEDEGLRPALVLSSDSRRTRETLDLIHGALGSRVTIHLEPRLYLADPSTLLDCLRKIPGDVPSVLMLGHNPGLQEFALALAEASGPSGADTAVRIEGKFPTAALARFRLKIEKWRDLSVENLDGVVKVVGYTVPTDLEPKQ
jgi:phosphohistidine phosphatase